MHRAQLNQQFFSSKNLDSNKNIGYQYGILYENDCLGIDFNYYRDLTKDRDIKESDGFSFTIVLKPFGSTKVWRKDGKLRSNFVIRENGRRYGLAAVSYTHLRAHET